MLKIFHSDIHCTMHISSAVVSADLSQCYDAVVHAIAMMAMRAFVVPAVAIKLVITFLQTMYFWLRTAHGVSTAPFHGTPANPFMGLSQGSGWEPSGFTAVLTLTIDTYKDAGNGVAYVSPVTMATMFLVAILFVNDTGLLMRAVSTSTTDRKFWTSIQKALDNWAGIVMVTGGSVKPKKCQVSVNLWRFERGVVKLKTRRRLPKTPITVLQKDRSRARIPLLELGKSRKMLGFYS